MHSHAERGNEGVRGCGVRGAGVSGSHAPAWESVSGSHAPAWESVPALGVVALSYAFPRASVGTRERGNEGICTGFRGGWRCRMHSHARAWERGSVGMRAKNQDGFFNGLKRRHNGRSTHPWPRAAQPMVSTATLAMSWAAATGGCSCSNQITGKWYKNTP